MLNRSATFGIKWLTIFLLIFSIGYGMRMYHEQGLREHGREIVLNDIKAEWKAGHVFYLCEGDFCIKFIPRRDDKSLNLNVVEGRI